MDPPPLPRRGLGPTTLSAVNRPALRNVPLPLLVAAGVVALEGLGFLAYAVLEIASLTSGRLTLGLSTAAFFGVYGAGLVVCALALAGLHSWARSPVVFAQLLQLGVAWSFRGGETTSIALALAAVSIVVLVTLFLPPSLAALSVDEE